MNDFVWVIIADESCKGGIIHEIYASKELALKELNKLAKKYRKPIYDNYFMVGTTTYSVDEYEVRQE
jgi:hypothetical protein